MNGEGTAITLVGWSEISELDRIKALTNTEIKELEVNPIYDIDLSRI